MATEEALDEAYATIEAASARIATLERERDEARDGYASMLNRISEIREASGLGAKPMLTELPAAIAGIVAERDAARLQRDDYRDERDNQSAIIATAIDEVAGAALDDAEARATAAEARVAQLETALKQAEFAMVEAAIPLEAIVAVGKGANSLAVWEGAQNAVAHVRAYMNRRALSQSPDRESGT